MLCLVAESVSYTHTDSHFVYINSAYILFILASATSKTRKFTHEIKSIKKVLRYWNEESKYQTNTQTQKKDDEGWHWKRTKDRFWFWSI